MITTEKKAKAIAKMRTAQLRPIGRPRRSPNSAIHVSSKTLLLPACRHPENCFEDPNHLASHRFQSPVNPSHSLHQCRVPSTQTGRLCLSSRLRSMWEGHPRGSREHHDVDMVLFLRTSENRWQEHSLCSTSYLLPSACSPSSRGCTVRISLHSQTSSIRFGPIRMSKAGENFISSDLH